MSTKDVEFLEAPVIGNKVAFLCKGQKMLSSVVTQVSTDPSFQGWFLVQTSSGSKYSGRLVQQFSSPPLTKAPKPLDQSGSIVSCTKCRTKNRIPNGKQLSEAQCGQCHEILFPNTSRNGGSRQMPSQDQLMNCPDCRGGERRVDCRSCYGSGQDICYNCGGGGTTKEAMELPRTCRTCGGSGTLRSTCCAGRGYVFESCGTCSGVGQLPRQEVERILERREEAARKAAERAAEESKLRAIEEAKREDERRKAEEEKSRKAEEERRRKEEEARQVAVEVKRLKLVSIGEFARATREVWLSGQLDPVMPTCKGQAQTLDQSAFLNTIRNNVDLYRRLGLPFFEGEAWIGGAAGYCSLTTFRYIVTGPNGRVLVLPLKSISKYSFTVKDLWSGNSKVAIAGDAGSFHWKGQEIEGLRFMQPKILNHIRSLRLWARLPAQTQDSLGSTVAQFSPSFVNHPFYDI